MRSYKYWKILLGAYLFLCMVISLMIYRRLNRLWFLVLYFVNWGFLKALEYIGLVQFNDFWNAAIFAVIPIVVALFVNWLFTKLVNRLY